MAVKKVRMFGLPLRITSLIDGFRRGGIAHPSREVVHGPETFTEVQAQQILDEAELEGGKLVVRELTDAEYEAHLQATTPAETEKTQA